MARPRFIDTLPLEQRAQVEAELQEKIRAGATTDELYRHVVKLGVEVARSTLASYAREIRGAGAEDSTRRARREVEVAARSAAPDRPDGDREDAAAAPTENAPAADEEPDGLDEGDPAARRRHLVRRIRAARALADRLSTEDPKAAVAAHKLETDLHAVLADLERRGAEAGARPRVVAYVPARRTLAELTADE